MLTGTGAAAGAAAAVQTASKAASTATAALAKGLLGRVTIGFGISVRKQVI